MTTLPQPSVLARAGEWVAGIGPGAWTVLGVAAVGLLWMVGAYNRLMALRNAVLQAWQPAHAALQQRHAAFAPLLEALREPLAPEHRALELWLLHHTEAARALTALAAQPLQAQAASALVAAEAQLAPSTSRTMALLDSQFELRQRPELRALLGTWQQAEAQLAFGRQLFNTAAEAHDRALLQWPTRLLVRVFSLAPVGRL